MYDNNKDNSKISIKLILKNHDSESKFDLEITVLAKLINGDKDFRLDQSKIFSNLINNIGFNLNYN